MALIIKEEVKRSVTVGLINNGLYELHHMILAVTTKPTETFSERMLVI